MVKIKVKRMQVGKRFALFNKCTLFSGMEFCMLKLDSLNVIYFTIYLTNGFHGIILRM